VIATANRRVTAVILFTLDLATEQDIRHGVKVAATFVTITSVLCATTHVIRALLRITVGGCIFQLHSSFGANVIPTTCR
jgi:hypothetical protein